MAGSGDEHWYTGTHRNTCLPVYLFPCLHSSPRAWDFHAIEPKGPLRAAGLAIGDHIGLFTALLDEEGCDAPLLGRITWRAVQDLNRLLQAQILFEQFKFWQRPSNRL